MFKLLFFVTIAVTLCSSVLGEWRWKDKVAVVTGASSGIGAEVALQLANSGMTVVGLARRENKIHELAQKAVGGRIIPLKCDLYSEDDIVKAFAWIEKNLGGVDVLVNNAGVFNVAPLSTGKTQDWKTMLDLNVLGLSLCSREALKSMRKRGDNGQIININSVAGHNVNEIRYAAMYGATKYAVTALSEGLQNELSDAGSMIKVSSISPGLVLTEGTAESSGKYPHIETDDIAGAILYILSTKPNVRITELTIEHY